MRGEDVVTPGAGRGSGLVRRVVALALAVGLVAAPAAAVELIDEAQSVTLRVGERAVLGGVTGPCGRLPKRSGLHGAVTRTGTIGFGGPGLSKERACGGPTPAIEVLFTAKHPGTETLRLLGRRIGVRVTP